METRLKTDVLIIGAGPTGLTMAAQLIRFGIDFILIDQKEGPTDLSKALVAHARTLEIFDQLGLAQQAVADGEVAKQAAFMTHGKIGGLVEFADMGQGLSPFPYMLIYEQSKTEHLLYDYIRQQAKEVQWRTELVDLKQDENGVTAVIKPTPDSLAATEGQTIEASYVVGADGARSPVRHLLDLGFKGTTHPRQFYVADVEMEFGGEAATLYVAFHEQSFLLMVPMEGMKHWRFIGNLPDFDEQANQETTYAEIEEKVKSLIELPLEVTKVRWFSTYKVHTRHAERFSVGRCFVAGDAAHIHTPAGGQGMNTGIQDAYNLAWKLAFVLKHQASERLLETYSEERLANAINLLKSTDTFFDAMISSNWFTQTLRDNIVPGLVGFLSHFGATRSAIFPSLSQIGITYRNGSLSQHTGDKHFGVKAGDRMPYFLVDGRNVYDHFREPRFHLIIFSDSDQGFPELQQAVQADYADVMNIAVFPLYPNVVDLFGNDKPFVVLLRPDVHIGMISQDGLPGVIHEYMSRMIGIAKPNSTQL